MPRRSVRKNSRKYRQKGGQQTATSSVYIPLDMELLTNASKWFPYIKLKSFSDVSGQLLDVSGQTMDISGQQMDISGQYTQSSYDYGYSPMMGGAVDKMPFYSMYVNNDNTYHEALENIEALENLLPKVIDKTFFTTEYNRIGQFAYRTREYQADFDKTWTEWQTYAIELNKMLKNWKRDSKHYLLRIILTNVEKALLDNFTDFSNKLPELEKEVQDKIFPILSQAQSDILQYKLPEVTKNAIENKYNQIQSYIEKEQTILQSAKDNWDNVNTFFDKVSPIFDWLTFAPPSFFDTLKPLFQKEVDIANAEATLMSNMPSQSVIDNLRLKLDSLKKTTNKAEIDATQKKLDESLELVKSSQKQKDQLESEVLSLKQNIQELLENKQSTRKQGISEKISEQYNSFEQQYATWQDQDVLILQQSSKERLEELFKKIQDSFSSIQLKVYSSEKEKQADEDARIQEIKKEIEQQGVDDARIEEIKQETLKKTVSTEEINNKLSLVNQGALAIQNGYNVFLSKLNELKEMVKDLPNYLNEATEFTTNFQTILKNAEEIKNNLSLNSETFTIAIDDKAQVESFMISLKTNSENMYIYLESVRPLNEDIKNAILKYDTLNMTLQKYVNDIPNNILKAQDTSKVDEVLNELNRQDVEIQTAEGEIKNVMIEKGIKLEALKYVQEKAKISNNSVQEAYNKIKNIFSKYTEEKNTFVDTKKETHKNTLENAHTAEETLFQNLNTLYSGLATKVVELETIVTTISSYDIPLTVINSDDGKELYQELAPLIQEAKNKRAEIVTHKQDAENEFAKAKNAAEKIKALISAGQLLVGTEKVDELNDNTEQIKSEQDILNTASEIIQEKKQKIEELQSSLEDIRDKAKQFRDFIDRAEEDAKKEVSTPVVSTPPLPPTQPIPLTMPLPIPYPTYPTAPITQKIQQANTTIQNAKNVKTPESINEAKTAIQNTKAEIKETIQTNAKTAQVAKDVAQKANSLKNLISNLSEKKNVAALKKLQEVAEDIEQNANENSNSLEEENSNLEQENSNLEEEEEVLNENLNSEENQGNSENTEENSGNTEGNSENSEENFENYENYEENQEGGRKKKRYTRRKSRNTKSKTKKIQRV